MYAVSADAGAIWMPVKYVLLFLLVLGSFQALSASEDIDTEVEPEGCDEGDALDSEASSVSVDMLQIHVKPIHAHKEAMSVKAIYYINLDASDVRRNHMESAINQSDIAGLVHREVAVTSQEVMAGKFDQDIAAFPAVSVTFTELGGKRSNSTIACYFSHFRLLTKLAQTLQPNETALIMEDDVVLPKKLAGRLQDVLLGAPPDWELLKICGWGKGREKDAYDANWYHVKGPFVEGKNIFYAGTCGYMVSGFSVQRVIEHLIHENLQDIDKALLSDSGDKQFPLRTYELKRHLIPLWRDGVLHPTIWHPRHTANPVNP